MALRNGKSFTHRPYGVTDAVDGSNAIPGSMSVLQNLIHAPSTQGVFLPRPAGVSLADMASKFTTPTNITLVEVVGTKVYGFCSCADFSGKDVPFIYDLNASAFITISGLAAALLPNTQPTAGDWTPPTVAVFSTSLVGFTHPGFAGGVKWGWLDTSGLNITSLNGHTTNGSTLIDSVSGDPYLAGVEPGMPIAGAGIPAGAYVVSTTTAPNSITISAAATATAPNVPLTITGGTTAAPIWGAGDTNKNGLASIPRAIAQFNGRAYFAVGNAVVYSDALRPRQVSNASQALILGDDVAVTALATTPLETPLTGGVLSSLFAFKGAGSVFQVTGDAATNNLVQATLQGAVGTLAPNTLCPTPAGLAYVAPDGVRLIDQGGHCLDPLGAQGDGVTAPFINVQFPSRMSAAFAHNTLRVSLQDITQPGTPWAEYWYNFGRRSWTGPHTGAALAVSSWLNAPQADFIYVPQSSPTKLFSSSVFPTSSSVFVEDGVQLTWRYRTTLLPDNNESAENKVVETSVALNLLASQQVTVSALNENGTALSTVQITGALVAGMVWGAGVWGVGLWGAANQLRQYSVPWSQPLVFKQMRLDIFANSGAGILVGNIYSKYQVLGYLLDPVQQQ